MVMVEYIQVDAAQKLQRNLAASGEQCSISQRRAVQRDLASAASSSTHAVTASSLNYNIRLFLDDPAHIRAEKQIRGSRLLFRAQQ